MLDNKGFDLWADGYDESVGVSYEENTYPFAGYKEILGNIYKAIMEKPNPADSQKVLLIAQGSTRYSSAHKS